jgi:glycine betaine transporter
MNTRKKNKEKLNIDNAVFWPSVIISTLLIIWGILANNSFGKAINGVFNYLVGNFSWLYLLFVSAVLLITIFIGLSKYGNIKLGKPNDKPELSTSSWFAILFGAGMGIGLVFWGIAEPINHYISPPMGQGETVESALLAIRYSFFHWGLHPWALYSLFGMMIAYFGFRKDLPQLPSSTLYPLLGEKGIKGPIGKIFDITAVFATLFGLVTSLGLGAQQINSGLNYLFDIPINNLVTLIIIGIITIIFVAAVVSGLEKGIKFIGNLNLYLSFLILFIIILLGPSFFIFKYFTEGLGGYLQHIFEMSFFTSSIEQSPWPGWWTIFYWAWWIAWTPFVGGFIARISKGRTIREFVTATLFLPTLLSFIWISTMGGSAIWLERFSVGGIIAPVQENIASAFFVTLSKLPLNSVTSIIALVLVATYFITSANGATFVMGMLTSYGTLNPLNRIKVIWGIAEGLVAAILVLTGGLSALQTASIAGAFPFMLFMIISIYSFILAIRKDEEFINEDKLVKTARLDYETNI